MLSRSLAFPSLADFWQLGKPRVVALIVFCAAVGILLAAPSQADWPRLLLSLAGIGLVAMGAAAANCLFERDRDAVMRRTSARPLVRGSLGQPEAAAYAVMLTVSGLWLLLQFANPLTTGLTLATFFGYAIVYTRWLKPATPQNIVIGGAAGAMPPVLGWAAVSGTIPAEAAVLFLIIYAWTPPHFWALALYRRDDYARAGLPMLPVTHGAAFTRLSILLYALVLFAVALLPFVIRLSGWLYLLAACWLGAGFVMRAWRLYRAEEAQSDAQARGLFRFSIAYLTWLFGALLLDRAVQWLW
ncbi:heme o synthase [Jeongeupia naejangsanensis]|uniref:Protoheme IX farnesyltransferase n=1 Tax=Jeongeupia naejangsanensis TaxID=613195 RepID=A0ABS2BQ92_9NEIS|nr:heme o synthase [Jeongeupia naejangsanensis]MBM3117797.1 protoheme IX farnesyltransferase [Jeongeupia naejangsanensis]